MFFNQTEEFWKQTNGYWTAREICQQPETWKKTVAQIRNEKDALAAFIARTTDNADYDIILTGAGTSEFVGNSIFPSLQKKHNYKVKSYGTTDIVADPESYISRTKPTLLISFGRSGNSPESVGAVEAANVVCENISHLFVTCNSNGALSKFAEGKDNCYAINLTPETHDQSFAMTSSYSNMYLATLLALNLDELDAYEKMIDVVIEHGQNFLNSTWETAKKAVDEFDFNRIVYLGSNNLKGVAQESALKICELTGGNVDTVFDTPMGFRHGPKSVINPDVLTVVYLSDDPYTRQYEYDIIREMSPERKGNRIMVVSSRDDDIKEYADYFISMDNGVDLPNVVCGLEYIMVAQTIAIFKSLKLGFTPDNPCPSGEVNRVVKGVILYPYTLK
ncbi:MAG: SIS domain-containing protein [Bulleidia sp.]